MKGTKKYSKNTTKKAIDTENDPYLAKTSPPDPSICTQCTIIYHNKRWRLSTEEDLKDRGRYHEAVCPACQKIKDKYVGGYVTLKGEFLKDHKEEILNLVRNKEQRARSTNPLERIIEITENDDGLEITTTTDKFAQMLGRVIHKSFSGEVEYKWSDDVKLARVVWSR